MLTTGVYTVECPKCKNHTLIHLASSGSINPRRCSKCELEFGGIGRGKQRHSFVGLGKEAEEAKKTDEKPFEAFFSTKKAGKKSTKW